jgi:predicted nucleic acid-binding protein
MQKCGDRRIDQADATLIHLATDLNSPDIPSLDRDFAFYRWGRNSPVRLLIGLDD